MDLARFIPGRAAEFADTREYELGRIAVPSGRLLIRDPFESRAGCGVLTVPPGSHRVWITAVDTTADMAEHAASYLPAYLSIELSTAPTVRLDYADDLMEPPIPTMGAWTGTDHGTIVLHDADVLPDKDIPALADEWSRTLNSDESAPFGCGSLPLPDTDGCNIVFSRSGWRDGGFPILATFDAPGRPNAIHVDFGVVDPGVSTPDGTDRPRARLLKRTPATYRTAAMVRLTVAAVLLGVAMHAIATGGRYLLQLAVAVGFAGAGLYTLAKHRSPRARKPPPSLNVEDRDRAGRTPLHYAAIDSPVGLNHTAALTDPALARKNFRKANEYKIANTTRLLAAGADVNAADHQGFTPLMAACARDSVDVVRILLDAGAGIDATSRDGTALYRAVRNTTPAALDITRLLRERGADPTIETGKGSNALEFVRRYGKPEEKELFADLL